MTKRSRRQNSNLVFIDEYYDKDNSKEFKKKKSFTPLDLKNIKPKTDPQSQFFDAYFQRQIPIITQLGSAGTGKTAIALYAALLDILDSKSIYDKIIIVRSAVQARDIGFLKGDEDEKNEVYEAPYKALCDELMRYKSNNYNNLKELGLLEFENTSFLRGQTWDNTVVIVDESQNMTYHELSTAVTRLGLNSRIIVCGDYKQVDLHKKGDKSGLEQFLAVLGNMSRDCVEFVNYRPEHIVRSGLVKEFLLAEEKT